jgi:hypothetical protein
MCIFWFRATCGCCLSEWSGVFYTTVIVRRIWSAVTNCYSCSGNLSALTRTVTLRRNQRRVTKYADWLRLAEQLDDLEGVNECQRRRLPDYCVYACVSVCWCMYVYSTILHWEMRRSDGVGWVGRGGGFHGRIADLMILSSSHSSSSQANARLFERMPIPHMIGPC